MNRSWKVFLLVTLLALIGGAQSCKNAETVSEADLLGTWEIRSWVSGDPRFRGCDMLGTLVFSPYSFQDFHGIQVVLHFKCAGIPQAETGYASMDDPPRVYFYASYLGRSIEFDGFYEDGRMIGRLGSSWSGLVSYNDGEWWEAVKKL